MTSQIRLQTGAGGTIRSRREGTRSKERRVLTGARGVTGVAGGTLGRRVRGCNLSVLSLQAVEIVRRGDSVSADGDHAELSLSALGREVGESNTSTPGVGHRARKQGGDFGPETGR